MEKRRVGYSLRVRLVGDKFFFGPGVDEILRQIENTGSLRDAAAAIGMSYSKAWRIIKTAEEQLGFLLLERRIGGAGGGSSVLTRDGRELIERYAGFIKELTREGDRLFTKYFKGGESCEAD